jgi:predicted DNA-binding protein (MmcQ/YjbR family)
MRWPTTRWRSAGQTRHDAPRRQDRKQKSPPAKFRRVARIAHVCEKRPMTLDDYNRFCASLPATTHVVQWGGAHVWKVGGKVFAIAGWGQGELLAVTFKCSEMAFDVLKDQPGLRPAPYLASRGMSWIQRQSRESMDDAALRDYLGESYRLILRKLPKRLQADIAGSAQSRSDC